MHLCIISYHWLDYINFVCFNFSKWRLQAFSHIALTFVSVLVSCSPCIMVIVLLITKQVQVITGWLDFSSVILVNIVNMPNININSLFINAVGMVKPNFLGNLL